MKKRKLLLGMLLVIIGSLVLQPIRMASIFDAPSENIKKHLKEIGKKKAGRS